MIRGAKWLHMVNRKKINNPSLLSLLCIGVLDWKAPNNRLHQATQAIRHGTAIMLRFLPHWGRGGLETNENILSTLQALVECTHHLPANNRLGTFQMFLQVPGQTHDVGTFMEHFECNINMCNTFDPP